VSKRARSPRAKQRQPRLELTNDRKVSPTGWFQQKGARWVPTGLNSFGLLAGDSCPDKTEFCKKCYAVKIEKNHRRTRAKMRRNLQILLQAGTVERMEALLGEMIGRYYRRAILRRLTRKQLLFRWHWDGDFFSLEYAEAAARVMLEFPQIQFFAYTRSFVTVNVVPVLARVPNLSLYLSVDAWNVDAAHAVLKQGYKVKLALCAEDYASARKLARGRHTRICPENAGRIPLMDENGGACIQCGICVRGSADVLFSTAHVEDVLGGQLQLWEDGSGIVPAVQSGCSASGSNDTWVSVEIGRPSDLKGAMGHD
jgi:hypothetical protein